MLLWHVNNWRKGDHISIKSSYHPKIPNQNYDSVTHQKHELIIKLLIIARVTFSNFLIIFSMCTGVQVNPCDARPCQNGGRCTSFGNQYRCDCPAGFVGTVCEQSQHLSNEIFLWSWYDIVDKYFFKKLGEAVKKHKIQMTPCGSHLLSDPL